MATQEASDVDELNYFSWQTRRLEKSPDHVERQRTYQVQDFIDQTEPADHSACAAFLPSM